MANNFASEMRTLDPVLTTLAQGYSNNNLVGQYLFPIVEVSKSKGRIPSFGKSAFIKRNVERATGSSSNRIPLTNLDLLEYECTEKDIEMAVDYLEEESSNDFYKFEQRTVKELCDIIELDRELEIANYVTNPANFAEGSKVVLDETNAFNTGGSPAQIIRDAINSLRLNIGVFPNIMIISNSTYQSILSDISIAEKIKYSGSITVSTQIISDLFDIPIVKIATSVYSPDGDTFADAWGNNIVLAYSDLSDRSQRSELNPSFGYTLRKKGMPEIDVYYEAGGKVKVLRNTDNYCIKVTSPDAAFLINNTIVEIEEEEG